MPDRGDNTLDIRQRGVFIDRIVADYDVRLADENRRTDHLIPELRCARDVRNNHLPDAAVLGVFLHHNEPPRSPHGFFDRNAVPRRNRAQV